MEDTICKIGKNTGMKYFKNIFIDKLEVITPQIVCDKIQELQIDICKPGWRSINDNEFFKYSNSPNHI